MRQRHRDDDSHVRPPRPGAGPSATSATDDAHARAERFHAAADEAIERALSGDSEAFLAASRQTSAQ